LAKAGRNYAAEYCRNGIGELAGLIGEEAAVDIGRRAARLTGLQQYADLADMLGCIDGGVEESADFLSKALAGMGDHVEIEIASDHSRATLRHSGLRFLRGMEGAERSTLLACWIELWRGAVHAQRDFHTVEVSEEENGLVWTISPEG